MSEFLVPVNERRTRDMFLRLGFFTAYSVKGAQQVKELLQAHYPRLFERMEEHAFANGAFTLEMTGSGVTDPLIFVSHLDSLSCKTQAGSGGAPTVPLQRAHLIALLEALDALLADGLPARRGFDFGAVDGRAFRRRGRAGDGRVFAASKHFPLLRAGPRRLRDRRGLPPLSARGRAAGPDRHYRKGAAGSAHRRCRNPGGQHGQRFKRAVSKRALAYPARPPRRALRGKRADAQIPRAHTPRPAGAFC